MSGVSNVLRRLTVKTFPAKYVPFRAVSVSGSVSTYFELDLDFVSHKRLGLRSYTKVNLHRCETQNLLKRDPTCCFCSLKTFTTVPENTGTVLRGKRISGSCIASDRLRYSSTTTIEMAQSSLVVGHNDSSRYFYILLDDDAAKSGPTAKLEYAWIQPKLVDLYHTEVPTQFRGQGVAKLLAKAAFDFFSEKDVTIRPSCTYLLKYLRENPVARYMDRVEKNFCDEIMRDL